MKLWLSDIPAGEMVWATGSAQASRESDFEASGRCTDLSDVPDGEPVAVIIPGQWARIYDLDLPKMRGAERLQAAGFAIEDRLAAPVSEQHLVVSSDGQRVGVISKAKMQAVIDFLKGAEFVVSGVYTDFDAALPGPAFRIEDRVVVPHSVTGGTAGYAIDTPLYEDGDSLTPADPAAQSLNCVAALNFASGAYGLRKSGGLSRTSLVRAAGLVAVFGLSLLGWQIMQARAANTQAEYLKAQAKTFYTNATGQAAPANPALTVTRALKSGGSGKADFMSLSAILFAALETTPEAQIDTLDYDSNRAQLRVRVIYPDLQTATQVEKAVAARGGSLTTGNLRERSGSMMGDAVLTSAGGS